MQVPLLKTSLFQIYEYRKVGIVATPFTVPQGGCRFGLILYSAPVVSLNVGSTRRNLRYF